MKLLLDENLPEKIRTAFRGDHELFTVKFMGWSGKKNGELMRLLAEHQYDALVTMDKNLPFQQNFEQSPAQLFVLDAPDNKISTLLPYIERLCLLLEAGIEDKVFFVALA
jgi:predicted nuclease of predicted toxin-antitoxin system